MGEKYWWVPYGTTDEALGPYFPAEKFKTFGGTLPGDPFKIPGLTWGGRPITVLVKVDKKPKLGPAPSKKFKCAITDNRETKGGFCYDRFFFKESCEMQWLLNIFLKEHMPTGGMPKVDMLTVHKDVQC